nr:GNAT family N-acetyltransferase [Anaerolineae bacterium]
MTTLQIRQKRVDLTLPVLIRTANEQDIARLEWNKQFWHYRELFQSAYKGQIAGLRLILVAAHNDYPIGRLFIQLGPADPLFADGKTRAYLYSFQVMEAFQGIGIGTALITHAEEVLSANSFLAATISVEKENLGARRLYSRLGYQPLKDYLSTWSYTDPAGRCHTVTEDCWLLLKTLYEQK